MRQTKMAVAAGDLGGGGEIIVTVVVAAAEATETRAEMETSDRSSWRRRKPANPSG
jgi:hypothetical protein